MKINFLAEVDDDKKISKYSNATVLLAHRLDNCSVRMHNFFCQTLDVLMVVAIEDTIERTFIYEDSRIVI